MKTSTRSLPACSAIAPGGRTAFITALLLLIFLLQACSTIPVKDRVARECREGDRESCAELAAIARSEKDWKERKRLVEMLTDDRLLVEFARNDDNLSVCKSAVDRMTDQAMLIDIARSAGDWPTRARAAAKITDQAVLAEIAEKDTLVRPTAVAGLTDQTLLAKYAREHRDMFARRAAVKKLTSQALLKEIIKSNEQDEDVRRNAVENENLTDQAFLEEILNSDKSIRVRNSAVTKLAARGMEAMSAGCRKDGSGPGELKPGGPVQVKCTIYSREKEKRSSFYERRTLNEMTAVMEGLGFRVVSGDGGGRAAIEVIAVLTTTSAIYSGSTRNYRFMDTGAYCRGAVSIRIGPRCLALILTDAESKPPRAAYVGQTGSLVRIHSEWLAKIADRLIADFRPGQEQLAAIAIKTDVNEVGMIAYSKITDPGLQPRIARSARTWLVRSRAVGKLTDRELLETIAKKDRHMFVRRDAQERLKELEKGQAPETR
jgi:hypothetical protein